MLDRWFAGLLREALSNLRQNTIRSLLAVLGIGIGSAALVAVLQIGMAAEKRVLAQFAALGTDSMLVRSKQPATGGQARLDGFALEAFLRRLDGIESAAVVIEVPEPVTGNGLAYGAGVLAASPSFMRTLRLRQETGRMLPGDAGAEPLAMLGNAVAGAKAGALPDFVRIGSQGFLVTGVLGKMAFNPVLEIDINNTVIVPLGAARRFDEDKQYWTALLVRSPEQDPQVLAARVRERILDRFGAETVISTPDALIEAAKGQRRSLTQLLMALGLVSLVTGGIGVANVMLVAVGERRAEIGLRMALGAWPQDILGLFVGEAIVLSSAGGLAGTLVGTLGSFAYAAAIGDPFALSVPVCVLGTLLATGTGVIAGVYPALLASRQDPSIVISSAA